MYIFKIYNFPHGKKGRRMNENHFFKNGYYARNWKSVFFKDTCNWFFGISITEDL